jgi:hypothetical protein
MTRTSYPHLILLALLMTLPSAVARAGDRDFDAVVSHIKKEYGAKRQSSLPFGLAGFVVRLAHPAGIKSIKVAILERIAGAAGNARLDAVVRDSLSADWQPIVRVFSRKEREQTYVYLRPRGGDMEFFVVAVDDEEATVVKAKVDLESAAEWLKSADWLAGRE